MIRKEAPVNDGAKTELPSPHSGFDVPDSSDTNSIASSPVQQVNSLPSDEATPSSHSGEAVLLSLAERSQSALQGMRLQAQDMMTRHLELVDADETLQHAAEVMRRCNIGFLPICEQGRPVGVLTDRDVTVRATAAGADPTRVRARDIMTTDIQICFYDQDVGEIARQMQNCQIRRVLVTDHHGQLIGVISLGDLSITGDDDKLSGKTLNRVSESNEPDRHR